MEINQDQPAQIYDMDKDAMVDNPNFKKEEPSEQEEQSEEESESEAKPDKKKPAKAAEQEEESEEEEVESEDEQGQEEPLEDENEEESEEEEKEDDTLSPDDYITSVYGEKYGVKTQAELDTIVENAIDLVPEFEELKKERDELKAQVGKPKFKSDKEQKAFEFLSQFDIDRQGESLDTFAKLISMDLEKTDPKLILEESFVHQNPYLTRAEAQRKFNREYDKKYSLNKEKWEGSDAEFAEREEDLKIDLKSDVAKAKNYLAEQKAKYKPTEKEAPKTNESVTKSIEQNSGKYGQYIDKLDKVDFLEGENTFSFKLDADRKKQVSEAMKNWVSNPSSYDDKGNLVGAGTPEEMTISLIGGLFIKDILKAATDEARSQTSIKRVDELAKVKPKSRSIPGAGDAKGNKDDLDQQALAIIKKRKAA
jgi:hypothetical protein